MKRRNKNYLYMTLVLFVIYIGLLTVLCMSEYTDSRATIRSFSDTVGLGIWQEN